MKIDKIYFSLGLLGSLILLSVHEPILAQSSNTITSECLTSFRLVKTDGGELNVRSNPNTNAEIIGRIPNGTEVMFSLSDRSSNWAEIITPEGLSGWVSAQYLIYSHHGATDFTGAFRVRSLNGDPVNLRAPGNSNQVIGQINSGTLVKFNQNQGYYTEVTTPEGTLAQIDNRFLVCN